MIRSIKLNNFKFHEELKLDLGRTTAILGQNGSGKSSILAAIGYGLFDVNPRGVDLLRRGAKSGFVEIALSGPTREECFVRRELGNRGWTVRHLDRVVAETRDDVLSWLAEHLAIPAGLDLKFIYENAVLLEQERFKDMFFMTPTPRRKMFQTMLGLEIYDEAWQWLSQPIAVARQRVVDAQQKSAYLKAKLDLRPKLEEELGQEETALADAQRALDETILELDRVGQTLAQMEEDQKNLASLEKREGQAQAHLNALTELIEEMLARQKKLDDMSASHKQETAKSRDLETRLGQAMILVAELQEEREAVSNTIYEKTASIRLLREQSEKLSGVRGGGLCPLCNQPLTEQHLFELDEQFDAALGLLIPESEEAKKRQGQINAQLQEIDLPRLEREASELGVRLKSMEAWLAEKSGLAKKLAEKTTEQAEQAKKLVEIGDLLVVARRQHRPQAWLAAKDAQARLFTAKGSAERGQKNATEAIARLTKELLGLNEVERQHAALAEQIAALIRAGKLLAGIRDKIRQVGPEVGRRVVLTIAQQANATFQDVLSFRHSAAQLDWSPDDYGLSASFREGEQALPFEEMSGGEQTVAAISARLAIMDYLNGPLLLLDEPTLSLDSQGVTDSLARAIMLKVADRQLLVVTHDDAFAGLSDEEVYL